MSGGLPVAVVGAGPAGLLAALELATLGVPVDLLSLDAPRRGPTASAGRSLAVDEDVEGHLADAIAAGEGLEDAAGLRAMIAAAPAIAEDLIRRGLPFARAPDGSLARGTAPGHRTERLLDAGMSTTFHVVHALDDALRAETTTVRRLQGWELLELVRDETGVCVGLVAQDLRTMEVRGFPAAAVILASGGFAAWWSRSSAPLGNLGGATAAALRAGARLVDPDRVDVHPIALSPACGDKLLPLPDALRAMGARVWVPKDTADRRRPRDVPSGDREVLLQGGAEASSRAEAARVLARALEQGRGVAAAAGSARGPWAYLDVTHLGRLAAERLGGAALAIERAADASIDEAPLPVAPSVHATLGGIAASDTFSTDVPGLFAIGGAAASFDGASRLAGHRLLFALFGARTAARAAIAHRGAATTSPGGRPELDRAERRHVDRWETLLAREAEDEPAHAVAATLGDALLAGAGALRDREVASALSAALDGVAGRLSRAHGGDRSPMVNRGGVALRRLHDGVLLARAVAAAAVARAARKEPGRLAVRVGPDGDPTVDP